jgi:hypothetical protein
MSVHESCLPVFAGKKMRSRWASKEVDWEDDQRKPDMLSIHGHSVKRIEFAKLHRQLKLMTADSYNYYLKHMQIRQSHSRLEHTFRYSAHLHIKYENGCYKV